MNSRVPNNLNGVHLRNTWLTLGWCGIAAVVYFSLTPKPIQFDVAQGDKIQHTAAYASLMFWFAQLYVAGASRRWLALSLVLLGVGMEFAQSFVPNRMSSVADMAANTAGVFLGWLISPPRTKNIFDMIRQRGSSEVR